mmetsp:Transcript_37860/g.122147  ORF Transcript_37860/g.122147 Transcript_37860/m.122147 type:complete len:201 (-) Transcript_37860:905-1507(-)
MRERLAESRERERRAQPTAPSSKIESRCLERTPNRSVERLPSTDPHSPALSRAVAGVTSPGRRRSPPRRSPPRRCPRPATAARMARPPRRTGGSRPAAQRCTAAASSAVAGWGCPARPCAAAGCEAATRAPGPAGPRSPAAREASQGRVATRRWAVERPRRPPTRPPPPGGRCTPAGQSRACQPPAATAASGTGAAAERP